MNKAIKLFLLLFFLASYASAQVQIISNYTGISSITLQEINNVMINNSTSSNVDCLVEIRLSNAENGEMVMSEVGELHLQPGMNFLSTMHFSTNYYSNSLSVRFKNEAVIREGRFSICILVKTNLDAENSIRDCKEIKLQNHRFLHLLSPGHQEEITELNPILQWTSTFDPETKYHLRLVELKPYRTAEEALGENVALLEQDVLDLSCLYPFNAPALQCGRNYAWQVLAVSQKGEILDYSEAWVFTPVNRALSEELKGDCYRLIYKKFNNGNYLFDDFIKFGYQNSSHDEKLNYTITDITAGVILTDLPVIQLNSGLNKIDIPVKEVKGLKEGHAYWLEIRNDLNERFRFSFTAAKQ